MRIIFTKQQPLTAPGGETSHLFALAHNLRALGVEVYLMPVTRVPTPADLWPPEFVRDVPPFGLHPLFDSFSISRAAAAFVQKTPVDAVLSWQYETAYLSTFTSTRNFIQGVVAAAPFGLLKQKATSSLSRRIAYHFFHFRQLRQAEMIFCASNFARNDLINVLGIAPQKLVVIPIGVDEIFQPPTEPKTGPLRNFIFVGSLEPIKGIFDALTALGLVYKQGYSDWSLNIVGWGDEEAVRTAAHQAGIETHLRFLGILDRPALAHQLAQADLALLPSHTETFGLAIAEAQACGLPVVSYQTGAIPEIIQDKITGLLANPFDQNQLAERVIQFMRDPDTARKMGLASQKQVRKHYIWKKTAQELLLSLNQQQTQKP